MSVIYHDSLDERDIAVTKGSAETILEICRYEAGGMELTDEDKVKITEMMNTFTDEGLVMVSSTSLTEREYLHSHKSRSNSEVDMGFSKIIDVNKLRTK
jgi:magnesium-transporting ATPase (P-type)